MRLKFGIAGGRALGPKEVIEQARVSEGVGIHTYRLS